MKGLTIGRAAKSAGVGVETIRFYERRGLIQQPTKPLRSGFRVYSDEVVPRIRFIRRSQEMGFSLRKIADLLSLSADPRADCARVRKHAAAKLAEVDHKLGELNHMRAALQEMIDACPARGAARNCTILQALQPTSKKALVKSPSLRGRNRRQQTMKSITLKVAGMHCEGCAATLEALVGAEEGVQAVSVSYKDGAARILFDPRRTSEDRLVALVQRPGYRVSSRGHD